MMFGAHEWIVDRNEEFFEAKPEKLVGNYESRIIQFLYLKRNQKTVKF